MDELRRAALPDPALWCGLWTTIPAASSPAFCPTPDLHNNVPERLSSLKCETMLWPLHSYPKLISYYPAFTLLYLPLIPALNTVHTSQSQDTRNLSLGFEPRQWSPFKGFCQTKFFSEVTKSSQPWTLNRGDAPVCVCTVSEVSVCLILWVTLHLLALREQWQELPGQCGAAAL